MVRDGTSTQRADQGKCGQGTGDLYAAVLLANVLQSLYGAVDLFVVGQYCDAQSVAAVSTGTQVTQIVTSLVTGLTFGRDHPHWEIHRDGAVG